MRTIRLEILRHGPPHNQLLSPLTEYFALCENHPAVTVRVPFEHAEFLLRLRALQYKQGSPEYRPLELEDISRRMTEILAQVPGLIRELAGQAEDKQPFHLRLILSANELALLPFEITNASQGFAGAGQPLLLQSQSPVCITREVRRVATEHLKWPPPPNPKILFAAAGPEAHIPLEEHLLVLRQAIDPWLFHYDDTNVEERSRKIAEHLTVLPRATLRQIEAACATGQYTHVHILAHGVPLAKGDDRRFGLALHDSADPFQTEVVEGSRLAKALRTPLRDDSGFAQPAVVTLASCDAGSVGSVVGAGASIAHALHDEGIPLVVASQFPLTFKGSVIMADVLYQGLLSGADPRTLLVNLRRKLQTQVPDAHDWASIVAYASLPPDIDRKLTWIQIHQAFRQLEAAFNFADRILAKPHAETDDSDNPEKLRKLLEPQMDRLKSARDRLEKLIQRSKQSKDLGILASADKRLAQIVWRMARPSPNDKDNAEVRDRLISSRKYYRETFRRDRSQVWALVQALVITALLRKGNDKEEFSWEEWQLARIFSDQELKLHDRQRQAWANANLMELYLLALVVDGSEISEDAAKDKAREHATAFVSVSDLTTVEVHSTKRQLLRYISFFPCVNPDFKKVVEHVVELCANLPESTIFA